MWYSLEHKRQINFNDLRTLYPNISFSASVAARRAITPDIAEMVGLVPLVASAAPKAGVDYDPEFQMAEHDSGNIIVSEDQTKAVMGWRIVDTIMPELDEDGKVVRTREQVKVDLEKEEKKRQKEEAKRQKEAHLAMMQGAVRNQRDQLLKESDVFVLPDFPHKTKKAGEAWVKYRKELRNITKHENFPHLKEEDWPVKPE